MLTLLIVDREGNQREEPGSRANTKLWWSRSREE